MHLLWVAVLLRKHLIESFELFVGLSGEPDLEDGLVLHKFSDFEHLFFSLNNAFVKLVQPYLLLFDRIVIPKLVYEVDVFV